MSHSEKINLIKYLIIIISGSIALLLNSVQTQARPIPDASMNYVVMVHLQNKEEQLVGFGAGIIISQSNNRTVIATAYHVVRDEIGDFRGQIAVEFNSLRGKLFPAILNAFYTDQQLDLALIFIDHISNPDTPRILGIESQPILSPTAIPDLLDANVQIVGFMNENLWAISHPKDKVVIANFLAGIKVKSEDVSTGASGGALIDSFGRILGMITHIDPTPESMAVALPMNRLLSRVAQWKIEFQLKPANAPTAPKELRAIFDKVPQFVIDFLGDYNNPFRYSISLILPQELAELSATVHLTVSDKADQSQKLTLLPPHYKTEFHCWPDVLKTNTSLMSSDGKLIAERTNTLDCETLINHMIAKLKKEVETEKKPRMYSKMEDSSMIIGRLQNAVNGYKNSVNIKIEHDKRFHERMREYEIDKRTKSAARLREALTLHTPTIPPFRLVCHYQSLEDELPQWSCDLRGNLENFAHIEDVIHSIKLGSDRKDLYIDIPLNEASFPTSFVEEESRKLLSEGKERIYMSIRLADGTQLQTWRMCVVSSLKFSKKVCRK